MMLLEHLLSAFDEDPSRSLLTDDGCLIPSSLVCTRRDIPEPTDKMDNQEWGNAISTGIYHQSPTAVVSSARCVQVPKDMDILKGNNIAKRTAHQPGNIVFRDMIDSCVETYKRAETKQKKTNVIRGIMHEMHRKHGARFLSKKGQGWIMSESTIRDTISRTLRIRGKQRKSKAAKELQQRNGELGEPEDSGDEGAVFAIHLSRVRDSQLKILEKLFAEDQACKNLAALSLRAS